LLRMFGIPLRFASGIVPNLDVIGIG